MNNTHIGMRINVKTFGGAVLLFVLTTGTSAATVEELKAKAAALVAQMTVDEKCAQLRNEAPAIPRLGIPAYDYWGEALHGVGRNGRATVFPEPIGMAASFDPELVREVASAIADEGRVKYLASIAAGVGCHVYTTRDDVLYANEDYVTLHATGDGVRTVRFKRRCSPYEVYEKRHFARDVTELAVEMKDGQTYTWFVGKP